MTFLNYYQARGHVFGECMSHPDSEYMYVYIPKNASSWTKPNLQDFGWEFYNYHTDHLNKTALVVLRDPVDRWVSGIAEYLYLYHKDFVISDLNKAVRELVFDKIAFDDHTERQLYFIEGLDISRCIFFKFGPEYKSQFSDFLNTLGMANKYHSYANQHVSDASPERKRFKEFFKRELENSKYLNKVQDYFREDINFIETVKYYGTR